MMERPPEQRAFVILQGPPGPLRRDELFEVSPLHPLDKAEAEHARKLPRQRARLHVSAEFQPLHRFAGRINTSRPLEPVDWLVPRVLRHVDRDQVAPAPIEDL